MPPTGPVKRYVSNVRLAPWSHLRVWLFCGGVLMLLYGLSRDPAWVETSYVDGFGGTAAAWLAWLTAPIPFSVAEVLAVLLTLWLIWAVLSALAEVGAGRRKWHNALVGGALTAADLVLVLAAWFYLAWGAAYARAPAAERFALPVERIAKLEPAAAVVLLREATTHAIDRTNESYREVHGSLDAGAVTEPGNADDLDASLERAYERLAKARSLPESFGSPRGPAKRPFLSVALSYLGIGGVYAPFTGEANVNGGPPAWSRLVTAAHEKAHQRMVTSEDEATFVGILALLHSDEPVLRYAGWQEARWQLQRALVRTDEAALTAIQGRLAAGPQRDVIALQEYWAKYQGPLEHVGDRMNDTYLKLNQVEGGIESYTRAAVLVAAWAQTPEGRAMLFETGSRAGK